MLALVPAATAQRAFEQMVELDDGSVARMWLDARAHRMTDLIRMTVEVETPSDRRADVAGTGRRLGDLRILNVARDEPQATDSGELRWRFVYTLEPLHDGEVVLRPVTVETSGGNTDPERANTRALTLEVHGGLPAGVSLLNPRDIALPENVEPRLAGGPLALAATIALAALGGLALGVRRWFAVRAGTDSARAPRDALAECRARLAGIDESAPRAGWDALDRALRECLSARHGIPALHRTTPELEAVLEPAVPEPLAATLLDLFARGDHARFSPVTAGEASLAAALRDADAVLERMASADPATARPS